MPAPADRNDAPLPTEGLRVPWERTYRDALDRSMSGSVVFYPQVPADAPGIAGMTPVSVPIVDGKAQAILPSGVYTVAERLVDAEGVEMPYGGSYALTIS